MTDNLREKLLDIITAKKEKTISFQDLAQPVIDLLERKNRDYGCSYDHLREEFGPVAFYVQLWDKFYRLEQVDPHGDYVGESALDIIKDIVGYCLLELRFRESHEIR